MSRNSKIRWTETDDKNLSRAINNFNAKIRRIEKKYPELKMVLPERANYKAMRDIIITRNDLNREINALKRFTSRNNKIKKFEDGSFSGVVTLPNTDNNIRVTKWQKNEMSRRLAVVNRRREKMRKQVEDIEMQTRGESVGYTKGEIGMGKIEVQSFSPMNMTTKTMTQTGIRKKAETINKEASEGFWDEKLERLKANYIKSITNNLTDDERAELVAAISSMSSTEFYKIYLAEDQAYITEVYYMDEKSRAAYVEGLKKIWVGDKHTDVADKERDLEEIDNQIAALVARRESLKRGRNIPKDGVAAQQYQELNKEIGRLRSKRRRVSMKNYTQKHTKLTYKPKRKK